MPTFIAPRTASSILAIVVITQLMIVLDASIVNLALAPLREDLGISATSIAWIPNAYVLAFGGLLLLGGRLGDILGRRPVFLTGVSLFTIASLVGGVVSDEALLILARALQGVGAAITAPSALAILLATFPDEFGRNRALGLYAAMSAAGGAVGLLVGGALTSWFSWRGVFFVNVPIGILIVAWSMRMLPRLPGSPGRFDAAGAIAGTVGITALVLGLIRAGENGWGDRLGLGALLAAIALLATFLQIERTARQPLLPLRLFARPTTAAAYSAMALVTAVMFGIAFYLAQWMQVALGYSALTAGLAFLPMPVLIFAGSRTMPRLIPHTGSRLLVLLGASSLTVATVWLTQLSDTSGYFPAAFGPLLFVGLGGGLLYMPLSALLLSGVRPEDSGAASGAMQAAQQIGGALGIAVLASIFGATVDDAGNRISFTDGVASAFTASATFAALCLLIVAAFVRPAATNSKLARATA